MDLMGSTPMMGVSRISGPRKFLEVPIWYIYPHLSSNMDPKGMGINKNSLRSDENETFGASQGPFQHKV